MASYVASVELAAVWGPSGAGVYASRQFDEFDEFDVAKSSVALRKRNVNEVAVCYMNFLSTAVRTAKCLLRVDAPGGGDCAAVQRL
ncbi:hypothetical protein L915_12377 [Phytophthora nicotianae]|uniref:Uncharacterized protein n=1 Tax=Phytophthora nicotianae TaxID=4792 RepID=W2GH02_PHYNI|nr:hypothetical protein L915_12377 [Phytophthora nicotianae]ETL35599.1 hypothetical protein L916_12287 [Phytophthora nicotianae]